MKLNLWQLFAITAWLGLSLSFAVSRNLSLPIRSSLPMLLTAVMLTFGRLIFPRPPKREHIDNDEMLQKLSDMFILGAPAFLLYLVGVSLLTYSFVAGLFVASFALLIYGLYLFSK